jgi:hypothetical protein
VRPPLFEDRVRTDHAIKRHDESSFAFLDRVDDVVFARVRALLNAWFAHWPIDGAEQLRGRMRSRDSSEFLSAFWELYLYEGLRRLGGEVSVEPLIEGNSRRRDFAVTPCAGVEFTMEAVLATNDDRSRGRESRLSRTYDLINTIQNTDFSIGLHLDREGSGSPPGALLRDKIASWISRLDRSELRPILEAGQWQEMPTETFAVRDWLWSVRALPVSDDAARRPPSHHSFIGIYPGSGGWSDPGRLRARLRNKRPGNYALHPQPYTVALLDTALFSGLDCMVDALFGDEAIQFARDDPASVAVAIRKTNGHWSSTRNTRLSAVLYGRELTPWSVASVVPTLWINPWAKQPLMTHLPWARYAEVDGDGGIAMSEPATAAHLYFGLPRGWPGPERPFHTRGDVI